MKADGSCASSLAKGRPRMGLAGGFAVTGWRVGSGSRVVRRVVELFVLADGLEAKYRAAVERLERLTPAVLAKAFRGEVVPQDPEDEPASFLLERIGKDREAAIRETADERARRGRARHKAASQSSQ